MLEDDSSIWCLFHGSRTAYDISIYPLAEEHPILTAATTIVVAIGILVSFRPQATNANDFESRPCLQCLTPGTNGGVVLTALALISVMPAFKKAFDHHLMPPEGLGRVKLV